jgi:hypothetical protein
MNASTVQLNTPSVGGWFAPFTNRQYCVWFYWLMVVSALSLVWNVLLALYKIVSSGGKLYAISNPWFWMMLTVNAIGYFSNRLLYSMCLNTV